MLTYSLDDRGADTLYEFLYKRVKDDILRGNLSAHDKLPSKRTFAENLGVSVVTVENAYAQLLAEGYIYSRPQRGFFVADIQNAGIDVATTTETHPERKPNADTKYEFDFVGNQTDSSLFPFSIWARLMREILTQRQKELMAKPPVGGTLELRIAIACHLRAFRGMNVQPDQIIVGAGTEYLYGLLIQLLGFDKRYGVENPGYSKIPRIYKSHNVSCVFIGMDKAGVCIRQLEDTATDIIHISPSHHFPTGIVTPVSRRYELLGWAAAAQNRYIIEDDYDSELRFSGRPIPPLQSLDVAGNVIYMNTFTKTLASTIRISYMVLPSKLSAEFNRRMEFYSCTVPTFEQFMLARFISEGFFEKHLNRMRKAYHAKRNMILAEIQARSRPDKILVQQEDSGLHFLLKIPEYVDGTEFRNRLAQCGVNLAPISMYYDNPPPEAERTFVMNYTAIPMEKIPEAVARIFECLP